MLIQTIATDEATITCLVIRGLMSQPIDDLMITTEFVWICEIGIRIDSYIMKYPATHLYGLKIETIWITS